jgi:hypothetical protein
MIRNDYIFPRYRTGRAFPNLDKDRLVLLTLCKRLSQAVLRIRK